MPLAGAPTRLTGAFLVLLQLATVRSEDAKCSIQTCPQVDPQYYTVHIVPHSHMDLGWLKTVEQYFFGTKAGITSVSVQYIYDSVLAELLSDPNKKFMFVETGFFELWWTHRDNSARENFKRLVLNGQIEFVSGGYVMNDEATVHYMTTINQMTYGLGILKEIFGECGTTRVGWQIDPFGHSREFASLLAQMGFQGLYLGRIDYQDKSHREATRTMEFNWEASESLPRARLTGIVLANNYSPPPGFCFDEFCNDDPIVEDPEAEEYNGPKRAEDFMKWLTDKANFYATNNFLVTMGNDFNYQNAHKWMTNLDALMRSINGKGYQIKGLPVRLVYSTPSCYLAVIQDQKMVNKTDDFFPYASDPHAYWTGYFTSRPAFKYLDRFSNNWFQATTQLAAMARLGPGHLGQLRRALAIAQHHDAVTGTAKQHVNDDYTKMVSVGLTQAEKVAEKALAALSGKTFPGAKSITFCRGLNISECDVIDGLTNGDGVSVTVYNPASQKVQTYIRIPVSAVNHFTVTTPNGTNIPFDCLPISDGLKKLAERKGKATHELVFPVEVDALSFTNVDIRHRPADKRIPWSYPELEVTEPRTISRDGLQVDVDPTRGIVRLSLNGIEINATAGYYFYASRTGNNTKFNFRASGAYIFRNDGPAKQLPLKSIKIIEGRTITEVRAQYGDWVYESYRIGLNCFEVDWIAGPIPIKDQIGKELVYSIDSNIDSGSEFFTDSNGRENLRRQRNFRPTWLLNSSEPVAGNYYPVNTLIAIKDKKRTIGIVTDSNSTSGRMEVQVSNQDKLKLCFIVVVFMTMLLGEPWSQIQAVGPANDPSADRRV
ncbi:lysosomal alpha-mannosidase-like isoform X2 [Varroa destructor]|uniref:Alpha-mannosidase n=1 Tax=Varroa destructor TaxID=109461 RepID=A0A7M7MCU3_VARDE|nr:lysosomal alpha-mannosidase-like isoform X2 [Varroa destructor]